MMASMGPGVWSLFAVWDLVHGTGLDAQHCVFGYSSVARYSRSTSLAVAQSAYLPLDRTPPKPAESFRTDRTIIVHPSTEGTLNEPFEAVRVLTGPSPSFILCLVRDPCYKVTYRAAAYVSTLGN